MLCKSCRYPLKQLSGTRCPECGREFDPDNSNTYFVPPDRKSRRWLKLLILGALIYLAVFSYALYGEIVRPLPTIANNTPTAFISAVRVPMSSKLLHAAILALIVWPLVVVTVFLFSLALRYARQMGVLMYQHYRWPYDDDPPLRS